MKTLASIFLCLFLHGCTATGPLYTPHKPTVASDAEIIIYRISQIGGKAGTWVPTRVEANDKTVGKLPDDSFIAFHVPAGNLILSVTPMVNLHYSDENRITLHEKVNKGEIAYFRVISIFGRGCDNIYEKVDSGKIAYITHLPRPDLPQTNCFQRVTESIAIKTLLNLREAK